MDEWYSCLNCTEIDSEPNEDLLALQLSMPSERGRDRFHEPVEVFAMDLSAGIGGKALALHLADESFTAEEEVEPGAALHIGKFDIVSAIH